MAKETIRLTCIATVPNPSGVPALAQNGHADVKGESEADDEVGLGLYGHVGISER
ncbi:MAG: hypothetical protein AAGF89_16975 [Bacteroidota bacterium]